MLQRALTVGGGGGGISHIECGTSANNSFYYRETAVSNDGNFTLGSWGNYSVTLLKNCKVKYKSVGSSTPVETDGVAGQTYGASYINVMLYE